MKTKKELGILKQEVKTLNKKLEELTEKELEEVTGGLNYKIAFRPYGGFISVASNMLPIVKEMEDYLETINKNITVAIMGCPVNGPGEAKEADVGVCGGKDSALLIKHGEIIKSIPQDKVFETLKKEIEEY